MTNQEILEKAIQKAIDGGWKQPHSYAVRENAVELVYGTKSAVFCIDQLIFNHDFAKALWGEARPLTRQELKDLGFGPLGHVTSLGWQDHLKKMVIAEDPIEYLGDHI